MVGWKAIIAIHLLFSVAFVTIYHDILISYQWINELEEISIIWTCNCLKSWTWSSHIPKQKDTLSYVPHRFVLNLMLFNTLTLTTQTVEWSINLLNLQRHKAKQIKTVSREQDFHSKQHCQAGEMTWRIWIRNGQRLFVAAGTIIWTHREWGTTD